MKHLLSTIITISVFTSSVHAGIPSIVSLAKKPKVITIGVSATVVASLYYMAHKKQANHATTAQKTITEPVTSATAHENAVDTKEDLTILKNTVEIYRKKMGINVLIEIQKSPIDHNGAGAFQTLNADGSIIETFHYIALSPKNYSLLNNSPSNDSKYYEALAILCHEMGHIKQKENPYFIERLSILENKRTIFNNSSFFSKIHALINKSYKRLYEEKNQICSEREQDADANIPNEKALLLAARDSFYRDHKEIDNAIESLRQNRWSISALCKRFSLSPLPPHTEIDFSQPMNEEYAQAWDKFHNKCDDYHPSFYRRAYYFNERLKKLDTQEERK